jgi:hypothetical protein
MSDVLRLVDHFDGLTDHPACRDYVARATARPAFAKARADQMARISLRRIRRALERDEPHIIDPVFGLGSPPLERSNLHQTIAAEGGTWPASNF